MTFLTNYSNITVDDRLTAGILTPQSLQTNIVNLKIAGGFPGQYLTANGSNGQTLFATLTPGSEPTAPGGNGQIIFSDPAAQSNLGTNSGLAYNNSNNILQLTGTLSARSLTANGNVVFGDITNIQIGGGTAGQGIVTDGAGNLRFQAVGTSALKITTDILNPVSNIYLDPSQVTLPAGTNTWVFLAQDLASANLINLGSQFAFTNDPQNILTVTAIQKTPNTGTPGAYNLNVTFYPSTRYAASLTPLYNTRILIPVPSTPQEFANLIVVPGTITANVANTVLTLTDAVPGSNGQIQYNNNGNLGTSSKLTISGTTMNANGTLVSNSVNVQNQLTAVDSLILNNTGNIFTSGSQIAIESDLIVSGQINSQGGLKRGIRYGQWRVIQNASSSIIPNTITPVYGWYADYNNTLLLIGDSPNNSVFRNTSNLTMYVLVAYQIAWANSGSATTRRTFIAVNNDTTNQRYADVSFINNTDDYPVQNATAMIPLAPDDYFQVFVYHNAPDQVSIGGAFAGQAADYSCKLTYTIL